MSKSISFSETPDAHKIIADHEKSFGAHNPMLLEFVTDHKANKLEMADVKTAEMLYGKNSKYGGKEGLVDVVYIDAESEKNKDLMLKYKVIESEQTTPLPTMVITDEQGKMIARQKGVYSADASKYGADYNFMNVDKLAEGLATVIPGADPAEISQQISDNVTYDQKPFKFDIPLPIFDFNLKEND